MSKNNKSKSNRSKKKRSKSKAGSSRTRNDRAEQKNITEEITAAPEQLNEDNQEENKIEEPEIKETEVEVKLYEPDAEASDISDVQNTEKSETQEEPEPEEESGIVNEPEKVEEPEPEPEEETEPDNEPEKDEETEPDNEPEQDEASETDQEQVEDAPKKQKKHNWTGLKVIGVLTLLTIWCSVAIGGIFAANKLVVEPDRFPKGSTLNNVDVSGMTKDEARDALTKEWNSHSISIFDASGRDIGEIKKFDFKYDIDEQLEHALHPGAETAISRFFEKEKEDIGITMTPAKSTKLFDRQFNDLSIVKEAEGDKPSKNAYIDKSDTEFRIVKEVIGNSVDTRLLKEAVFKSIADGNETFRFRRSDYHKLPEIISTSKSLLDERQYCIKYLSFSIRYRNPVNDYTIPPSWLDKMIRIKKNGKVEVNDEQVSQFISETLYPKFSSVGGTRKLKSAGGGTYTISGGTYGYTVDVEKEHNVLTSELKKREDVEREPFYSGKTPGKNWENDIGDDYVEVSIENQTVWVVRHGKVIVETPVVTGVLPRHSTPTGVFYIVYKATNTTLKGRNDDGSKYESHVAYWMPFYLGFGLHDANWRGAFGGSIYVYNGSHGCVNCPPYIMPKIFSNCYEGMPVIVH